MAIKKVKLPNNTVVDINDARIPGVDSTPTSGSTNVVTSGGVKTALDEATVTESTVSGWGFTKNTGTLTGVKFNGTSASVSNGVASITATIPAAPGTLNTTATTAQSTSASEALSGSVTLHKVAKTGTYSDLIGKPTIPSAPGTLNTTATSAQSTSSSEALSGSITLHKVSKTGSYNDLNNKPTIPSAPGTLITNATSAQTASSGEAMTGSITLHKVSKTGTYSDLVGTPNIPLAVYFDPSNQTLYFFKSTADRDSFVANKTQTSLILFSACTSPYIRFKDSKVLAVLLANNIGDGTGVTEAQAAAANIGTIFQNNTEITSFNELQYFYSTSIAASAFSGCTSLREITIPSNVTSIGGLCFNGCISLESITINGAVTSMANSVFRNCKSLVNLTLPSSLTFKTDWLVYGPNGAWCGAKTGTLHIMGNATVSNSGYNEAWGFKKIIVDGNFAQATCIYEARQLESTYGGPCLEQIRIGGNYSHSNTTSNGNQLMYRTDNNTAMSPKFKFLEVMGTLTSANNHGLFASYSIANDFILHLGYDAATNNALACPVGLFSGVMSMISKIYFGPGRSLSGDQSILNKYNADTGWSAYSSKFDLWYNYNGEYKNN